MARFMITVFILAVLLLGSCTKDSTPVNTGDIDYDTVTDISYATHVQTILNEYATILQAAGLFPEGLVMDSWQNLIRGWKHGEVLIPYDAENSLLIELTAKQNYANPLRADKLDLLRRWIDAGAKNDAGEVPYANSTDLLFVCSQGEAIVNVIETNAKLVVRNIHLTDYGIPALAKPHHIEFSPDGQYWYVSCIDNSVNKILKFTTGTYELMGEATTDIPALLAHHPTENILYVSRFMQDNNLNSIYALNTETMQPIDNGNDGDILLPGVLSVPHAMTIDHTGNYAYTASFTEDAFVVINNATKEFEEAIPLGLDKTPLQGTVSPDNRKVYLSCIGTGEIAVIDISDPANRSLEGFITVGGAPWHSVFNGSGSKFYVANFMMNKFSVIDVAGATVQTYGAGDGSDGLSQPHGIAISHDNNYVFIASRNTSGGYVPAFDFGDNALVGTVTVINTASNAIEKVIEIENFGSGMRLLPQ